MKRPDNIHDAMRHLHDLTMSIANDMLNYMDNPQDYKPEYFEAVKDAALDAHLLVTWVRDNLIADYTSLEYKKGVLDARVKCINLVMKGTKKPVQTATLKALERDRLRIAKLIAGDEVYLRNWVDNYTMSSKENKV